MIASVSEAYLSQIIKDKSLILFLRRLSPFSRLLVMKNRVIFNIVALCCFLTLSLIILEARSIINKSRIDIHDLNKNNDGLVGIRTISSRRLLSIQNLNSTIEKEGISYFVLELVFFLKIQAFNASCNKLAERDINHLVFGS